MKLRISTLFLILGVLLSGCTKDKGGDNSGGNGNGGGNVNPPVSDYTSITLTSNGAHDLDLATEKALSYRLTLTGNDPYVFSNPLASDIPANRKILEFSYKCTQTIDDLQIFYGIGGTIKESNSKKYGTLSASSAVYKTFTADISSFRNSGWGKKGNTLRIDPGTNSGFPFYIRDIKIREMTDEEKKAADKEQAEREAKENMAKNLASYLSKEYASSVTSVVVSADKVTIEGDCASSGSYRLADICPWQDVTEMSEYPYTEEISNGKFSVTVDRIVKSREGIDYDRVFSKWAVVKVDGDSQTLDSHARYADEVVPVTSPEPLPLKNKKGFGAGDHSLYFQDCDEMNIGSITMNTVLSDLITGEGAGYSYGGVNYSLGNGRVNYCDRIAKNTQSRGITLSAIILITPNSLMADPECSGGYYAMPNMTTAKAFNMYAAALNYMAKRYSNDAPGRIHHWIMHNEVDAGSEWTNMGEQPMMRYLDRYVKSMRICYNIVRQYDQNASILGSFTHFWTQAFGADGYAPKEMLEGIVAYSKAEGDFRWGVAYHPYPQDLSSPEFWNNDTQSEFNMNTKFVTFKNLEVIDKWIKLPENLYKGETKRILFLSEQGTNSPSYSERDLTLQAAGGAWAWKKVSRLDGIDAMQWHNWADNKAEFGLRIGLRSFEDAGLDNLSPKPVWYVWKAAGTDEESKVFDPYLSTIGKKSWDDIMGTVR